MITFCTLGDESILAKTTALELIRVSVWKGNRIIDPSHVAAIKATVGDDVKILDFGYRLVTYDITDASGKLVRETVLVDGQHRHAVLVDYFANLALPAFHDFPVVVTVKHVECEDDIVEYFNCLNSVKPITWDDTALVINKYIAALEKEFNSGKVKLIRQGGTGRPYLSVDKLREALGHYELKGGRAAITEFVNRVVKWNTEHITSADARVAFDAKYGHYVERAAATKFMLAIDPKMPWIRACLGMGVS